jgi:hypothetical protein
MNNELQFSEIEISIIKKIENSILGFEKLVNKLDTLVCALSGIEKQKDTEYFNKVIKNIEEKNEIKK